MRLCYLYSNKSSYPHIDTLLDAFKSTKININTISTIDEYEIYVIELQDTDKEIFRKTKDLFTKKSHSLIYFVIPKNHTILLFQLAFMLNTKSIITHTQDVNKLITKIKTDEKISVRTNIEKWLGHIKISTQEFLIYKNKTLIFINENLLEVFSCDSELQLKEKILSQIDTASLLDTDSTISMEISDTQNKTQIYKLKSLSVSDSEQLIYIDKSTNIIEHNNLLSSRFSFVEILKEKILETSISEVNISLLTIGIGNSKQLSHQYGIVDFENQLSDLLSYMNTILNNKLIFSQFENDFYVIIFENISYDKIQTIANTFHTQILKYIQTQSSKILLELFTFNLDNRELDQILSILRDMEAKKFSLTQENKSYVHNVTNKMTKESAKDILESAYTNNIKLKILNIYHGLVINTNSKILKVTDKGIYIQFESLQGIVLQYEKKTVLQSEYFTHDIYADVKQINLSKKIALLENFKFLQTNANARKYARVTPSIKTPITIYTQSKSCSGIVLDLSIKSIAIQTKNTACLELDKLSKVSLVFNLLDQSSENGYLQLTLDAKIMLITDLENNKHKIICDLEQDTHDIDIVLKYVYERQKELIIELKKMSKLN